jgi:hypothetical protein
MRLRPIVAAVAIACALPPAALAADKTLKDAINCADFKHNADGSWYTKGVSLAYGPGNQTQINYFGATTITSKDGEIFADLNEKCGAAK